MISPTPTQDMQVVRPRKIAGFEIISKIGQGAMGTVYKARQIHMDRLVALKILPQHFARNKTFIDRFIREARASAKLNHNHIVQGIDGGLDEKTGHWYFAMEYVDGPTVGQELRAHGAIPETQALKIVRGIARGLACAAKAGIVHRDIKPDNIILTRNGEPKLADLGLAHHVMDDAKLTRSGTALGTPHYMAPEQAAGEQHKIDTRSDIYALGATLYHMVTGRTPFTGNTGSVIMTKHLMATPTPANEINPRVSQGCTKLIQRMMAKEQAGRYPNPKRLLEALDALEQGQNPDLDLDAVSVEKPPTPAIAPSTSRRLSTLKRKLRRRKTNFVRKKQPSTALNRVNPMRSSGEPVILPARMPSRNRESGLIVEKEPSQVKGFFVDLAVIVVMGGLLFGGYYSFMTNGGIAWIKTPPTTSIPATVQEPGQPVMLPHSQTDQATLLFEDQPPEEMKPNNKPTLVIENESSIDLPAEVVPTHETFGAPGSAENNMYP